MVAHVPMTFNAICAYQHDPATRHILRAPAASKHCNESRSVAAQQDHRMCGRPPSVVASSDRTIQLDARASFLRWFKMTVLPEPRGPSNKDVKRGSRGPAPNPCFSDATRASRPTSRLGCWPKSGVNGLSGRLSTEVGGRSTNPNLPLIVSHKRTSCLTNAQCVSQTCVGSPSAFQTSPRTPASTILRR